MKLINIWLWLYAMHILLAISIKAPLKKSAPFFDSLRKLGLEITFYFFMKSTEKLPKMKEKKSKIYKNNFFEKSFYPSRARNFLNFPRTYRFTSFFLDFPSIPYFCEVSEKTPQTYKNLFYRYFSGQNLEDLGIYFLTKKSSPYLYWK